MTALIYVSIGNGVLVPHTPEEWARLTAGVDMEAALAHGSPLETDEEGIDED